jgi:hypothetical protein
MEKPNTYDFVVIGSGFGGSLVYANVLMERDDNLFSAQAWSRLADWKAFLRKPLMKGSS